ncbi:YdcF family protein [Nocardia sp. NPDC050799]|uniref:YdcF family protein n=1 Tax=Nocardia sp. NPDC050799 TaxID=3154842 RepID=UPI0033CAD821
MGRAGGPGPGDPAEFMRQAAERAAQSATTGAADTSSRVSQLADAGRALAHGLLRTDHDGAVPVDATARALIRDGHVHGDRWEPAYTEWLQGLRDRGVDTDRAIADLGTIWDFLRHDPKWTFDPSLEYGGVLMFGSPDIGGAAALTGFVRHRGLTDVPVVFSGYADPGKGDTVPEAVRFRTQAEKVGLGAHRILEDRAARNTGENATNSLELLRENGRAVSSVIGVCTPQHARRVWATIMKQGPDVEHAAVITADVSVENFLRYGMRTDAARAAPPGETASAIMGEIKRLDDYPAEGHIVAQAVPDHIRDTYDRLAEVFRPTGKRF